MASKILINSSTHLIETSTPVIRTGVIQTCRSPSPQAVASLSHGPRNCPASLSHLAKDRPMHYRLFSLFGLEANPCAKVHQRGDDLVDSQIYHPAKFHRPTSTHARDIPYQKSCGHTNINDISPTCLSACGDTKFKVVVFVKHDVYIYLYMYSLESGHHVKSYRS